MPPFDRLFQKGSLFRLVLVLITAAACAQYAVIEPAHRFPSLFVVIVALGGAAREYAMRRRLKAQKGVRLLDSDPRE